MNDLQKPLDALGRFNDAVNRIRNTIIEAERARKLPDERYSMAMRVKLMNGDSYWKADEEAFQDARKALGAWVAEQRKRGERERDEKLKALSLELHSLRAVLPALAAAATIQLGAIASGMSEDSTP